MPPPLHRLPLRAGSGLLHAVVDTPKNELLGRRFRPVRRSGPARAHDLVEAARVDRGDRD